MMRSAWLLVALTWAVPASAQQRWLDAGVAHTIGLSVSAAVFDDQVTASPVLTLALRGRYALADNLVVTTELPFAHAAQQAGLSGTRMGNPWVGLEHRPASGLQFELGARLNIWPPRTQRHALPFGYGQLVDFDRREAWSANASAVRAMVHFGHVPAAGSFATAKAGLVGFAASGSGGDGELLAHYGGRAGVVSGKWVAWLGVIGQGIVTDSESSLADRTVHQAEIAVAVRRPGRSLELALRRFVGESFGSNIPLIAQVTVSVTP